MYCKTPLTGGDGGFEMISLEQGGARARQRTKTDDTLHYRVVNMGKLRSTFESVAIASSKRPCSDNV